MYNYSLSNAFAVKKTRAGSILTTTQQEGLQPSTLTQNSNGWSFDWGMYNSTLGRREHRIVFDSRVDPNTGLNASGLNMTGNI